MRYANISLKDKRRNYFLPFSNRCIVTEDSRFVTLSAWGNQPPSSLITNPAAKHLIAAILLFRVSLSFKWFLPMC